MTWAQVFTIFGALGCFVLWIAFALLAARSPTWTGFGLALAVALSQQAACLLIVGAYFDRA